ncbi:hypothetical protein FLA_1516 [Filimonas lacunae]|nr:hypothetical protein FLA_1516 [Filimonas lacunae]
MGFLFSLGNSTDKLLGSLFAFREIVEPAILLRAGLFYIKLSC